LWPQLAQFETLEWIPSEEKKRVVIEWMDPTKKQLVRPPLQLIQRWVRQRDPEYAPFAIFGHIYPEHILVDITKYSSVRLATVLTKNTQHPICELSVIKSLPGEKMPRFRMHLYSSHDMSITSTYEWTWKTKNELGQPQSLLDMVREYTSAFLGETLTLLVPTPAKQ